MLLCNPVCMIWFTAILVIEPIEHAHQGRLVEASRSVQLEMTPEDVLQVLGEPDAIYDERKPLIAWLMKDDRPKQWMYGTTFNLDYLIIPGLPCPNPLPVNLRIVEYAPEDLVIDWSRDDRVAAITRPELEVPPEAEAMLDASRFSYIAVRVFVFPLPAQPAE